MTYSLKGVLRYALLLATGFILGLFALESTSASNATHMLWDKLGMANHSSSLSDASCKVPKDTQDTVYFVSCGGFF